MSRSRVTRRKRDGTPVSTSKLSNKRIVLTHAATSSLNKAIKHLFGHVDDIDLKTTTRTTASALSQQYNTLHVNKTHALPYSTHTKKNIVMCRFHVSSIFQQIIPMFYVTPMPLYTPPKFKKPIRSNFQTKKSLQFPCTQNSTGVLYFFQKKTHLSCANLCCNASKKLRCTFENCKKNLPVCACLYFTQSHDMSSEKVF